MIDKDFPAFPRQHDKEGHNGMTLRDYFAAAALPAIIAIYEPDSKEGCVYDCSESAYQYADAMLEARES